MFKTKRQQQQAIALRYREKLDPAPVVTLAEAKDNALLVKRLARRYGIPLVKHKQLAKELSTVKVNNTIPKESYQEVAKIFAALQQVKK